MRQLTDHIVEGDSANHQLTITVLDEPGQGGACHRYDISGIDTSTNVGEDSLARVLPGSERTVVPLLFQNGPIKEVGVNGITHEALLAILIDRLRSFQAGPYANRANAIALTHGEEMLMWLQQRTRERIKRGVEGTHAK